MRLVSIGEITIDTYLDMGQQFVGGIALNFAVHAKRSGAEHVALVSRAGTDQAPRIFAKLAAEGIDATHVQVQSGATARQDITVAPNGERIFPPGGYTSGVLADFIPAAVDMEFIVQHDVLACAFFRQVEPLFAQVLALPFSGARVADFLDLSDSRRDHTVIERYAEKLTIAFVSGNLALAEKLRPLSRATRCLLVVTLGAEGSLALVNGEPLHQPALPVPHIVDTTGCGDAFQAAFTVAYLRTGDPAHALQRGAEQAALVTQHLGASG